MTKPSWRDAIRVHPAADIFPMMSDDELLALGEDIKRNGLNTPISIVVENTMPILLDGRNRLAAMERVGIKARLIKSHVRGLSTYYLETDYGFELDGDAVEIIHSDPAVYIASANLHRRHLTAETKRDLIVKLLKEKPERSDRATAELAKVDHKTVGTVRRQEETRGNIPHVEKRVDTKGRQQPAKKPSVPGPTATVDESNDRPIVATEIIGKVGLFAEFCRSNSPVTAASLALPTEVTKLQADLAVIEEWLGRFAVALAENHS